MTAQLTEEEWSFLSQIPELDLVELAIELDLLVPELIDHRALTTRCVLAVVERAREEGLPFSKYDREDLAALSPAHLSAIARLQRLDANASVDQVLAAGQQIYRRYQKTRPRSAVALLLPSMLPALARLASE